MWVHQRFVVACLLLLVVGAVFISPMVHLEPSALRAIQAAQALAMALMEGAFCLSGTLGASFCGLAAVDVQPIPTDDADLLDLNCVRLC